MTQAAGCKHQAAGWPQGSCFLAEQAAPDGLNSLEQEGTQ